MAKTRRYSLREERRRVQRENPPIEIVIDSDEDGDRGDGYQPEVFTIHAAPTWTDEVLVLSRTDAIAAAHEIIVVGPEALADGSDEDEARDAIYDRFKAAGGSAQLLFAIAGQTDQGATPGE